MGPAVLTAVSGLPRAQLQRVLPTEDAAMVLLVGLVVSGQIRLRRLDGWRQIPALLRENRRPAA